MYRKQLTTFKYATRVTPEQNNPDKKFDILVSRFKRASNAAQIIGSLCGYISTECLQNVTSVDRLGVTTISKNDTTKFEHWSNALPEFVPHFHG